MQNNSPSWKSIGEVAEVVTGSTPKKSNSDFYGGIIPWIKPGDVQNRLAPIRNTDDTLSDLGAKQARILPPKAILVTCIGEIGRVGMTDIPAATNQQINAVIFNDEVVPEYGLYAILYSKQNLEKASTATTVPILNKSNLQKVSIPILPKEKQFALADKMKQLEAARELRADSLRLLDNYLRSLFIEMFGDPVTNSKGLPTKKLPDVGNLARGKSKHRPRNAPELFGGPYPFIQTGNITNAHLFVESYDNTYSEAGLKQSKLWPQNTLAITIAANIAFAAIVKFESCFPDSVVAFEPGKEIIKEYALIWLSFLQKSLEASAPQSAQKNINLGILSELQIPVPPIEQQELFKESFYQIFDMMTKQRASERDLKNLFDSLLKEAFH